jgi:hypothetical protein
VLTAIDLYYDHFRFAPEEPLTEEITSETDTTDSQEPPILIEREQEEAVSQPEPKQPTASLSPQDVKVQVLNGCGVKGIAFRIRGVLRDRGFDVMSYGNAKRHNYSKSQIIIRSRGSFGNQAADLLAESLNIAPDQISRIEDASLVDINLTLVIGSDYRQLNLATE